MKIVILCVIALMFSACSSSKKDVDAGDIKDRAKEAFDELKDLTD